MTKKIKRTLRRKFDTWLLVHPKLACFIIGSGAFISLTGLYLFVVFSGFGSSADFIYNQF